MRNLDVREQIKEAGLYQYEIASELGVCESTFIRWLRETLPPTRRTAILEAVQRMTARREVAKAG